MNTDALMKYVAGAFLYGMWAWLVYLGKTDPQPLIVAIGSGISALLGYHAVTNLQAVTPPRALPPLPVIPLSNPAKE